MYLGKEKTKQQSVTFQHSLYFHLWSMLHPQHYLLINTDKGKLWAFTSGPDTCTQASTCHHAKLLCTDCKLTLFSSTSSHVLHQWFLLPHSLSCSADPFSTVLEMSVLKRSREVTRYPNLSTWCIWKVKTTEEEGEKQFYNKEGSWTVIQAFYSLIFHVL